MYKESDKTKMPMEKDGAPMALDAGGTYVKEHPLAHGCPGGTNEGRVDVPIRGPGEISAGAAGVVKGKAQVAYGTRVNLAQDQFEAEGGYRATPASGGGAGKTM